MIADRIGRLYRLTFQNGKSYIGITSQPLGDRICKHIKAARKGEGFVLGSAIRKHGEHFSRETLVIGRMSYLRDAEIAAIAAFKTRAHGYNVALGGQLSPSVLPEVAAKVSAALRGKPKLWLRGRHLSAEQKAKLSVIMRRPEVAARLGHGRLHSAEGRRKISLALTGKKKTEAHRAALSKVFLGRAHPYGPLISKAHLGKPLSASHRAAIGASQKGRQKSLEHRRHISEARILFYQNRSVSK